MLQLLVNMIMPQNLPASCYNFTGVFFFFFFFQWILYFDLIGTWPALGYEAETLQGMMLPSSEFQPSWMLNFQAGSVRKDLLNVITFYKLPVSSRNFIVVFSISKSQKEFNVVLCVTFLNFQTTSTSSCLVNEITPQELPVWCCNFMWMCLPHHHIRWFQYWPLCDFF